MIYCPQIILDVIDNSRGSMKKYLYVGFVVLIGICCFARSRNAMAQNRPAHTRLCYVIDGRTNIWFHSFLRCRMTNDECFSYFRHNIIPRNGSVFFETGGCLSICNDRITYIGMTNEMIRARSYLITQTNCVPHCSIW